MRFRELIDLVGELANNNDYKYSGVKVSTAKDLINEVQRRICRERWWSWLLKTTTFSTVASQEEYLLPKDLREIYTIIEGSTPQKLSFIGQDDFDILEPLTSDTGVPTHYRYYGLKNTVYTTGTVAVTAASKLVTGTGTSWSTANNIYSHQRITIDDTDEVYTIASAPSTTLMALNESVVTTDTSSTYSIKIDNQIIRLYPIPDSAITITLRYFKNLLNLIDDEDESEIADDSILAYGAAMLIKAKNDEDVTWLSSIYQKILKDMRTQDSERFDHIDQFSHPIGTISSQWDPFQR